MNNPFILKVLCWLIFTCFLFGLIPPILGSIFVLFWGFNALCNNLFYIYYILTYKNIGKNCISFGPIQIIFISFKWGKNLFRKDIKKHKLGKFFCLRGFKSVARGFSFPTWNSRSHCVCVCMCACVLVILWFLDFFILCRQ